MKRNVLLIIGLLIALTSVIFAQNTDLGGVGDSLFPTEGNTGYDVIHYDITLEWDGEETITAVTRLTLIPTQDLTTFHLDFHGLSIDELTVNDNPSEYTRDGDEVIITPSEPLADGTETSVTVHYHGIPETIPSQVGPLGWNNTSYGAYVASEPTGAKTWYPVNNHPTDPATYTFTITTPKPNTVIANGILTDEIDNGDTTTFVWEAKDPAASYLTVLAIGEYHLEEQTGPRGLPIYNYYHVDVPERAVQDFVLQPEMLEHFEELFGEYPFESYGAIVIPEVRFPALETQTRPIYGQQSTNSDTIAHELAHQWFGNVITLSDWRDLWLKEGIATYAEYLFAETADRPVVHIRQWENLVMFDPQPPNDISANDMYHIGVYLRAGLMLHQLRLDMGDDLFFDLLQSYIEQFQGGSASAEDFMTLAEEISGVELDDFFDAWLNDETPPTITE